MNENIINASPTKELFISMLVKDLELKDAIGDLVDNSVDGARRMRGNEKYNDLFIEIEAKKDYFKITDNCGGIPADLARDYAFRFGRPPNMPTITHSLGQFGIGMKRALFKLGKKFKIESTSINSRFTVEVDVDEWKKLTDWNFTFDDIEEDLLEKETKGKQGIIITVPDLHEDVAEQFKLENFINELIKELRYEQLYNISKGLKITVNGNPLDAPQFKLLQSDCFKTLYHEETLDKGKIHVKIYAGASERDLDAGGWYIFCNDRLILGPEQSEITGWGVKKPTRIPKYHSQFDRSRGYVFFDADDASLLPLNTTKTNMDTDSRIFKRIRQQMISLMRPIINFLNRLHDEGGQYQRQEIDDNPLERATDSADLVELSNIETTKNKGIYGPKRSITTSRLKVGTIQYTKPLSEIEEAKQVLEVSTNKEVGKKTFEYFMEMEVNE
ncbi:ATP-binding protein [bacterium]|nr:ATP-binding protein [bacterium]